MPIRTQLLKKWVGPDAEKHIGSTPLCATNAANHYCDWRKGRVTPQLHYATPPTNGVSK